MGEGQFTTKELSRRTFPDLERFFSQVHGCVCTLHLFGRHLPPVAGTAMERAERLGAPDRSRKHFPHRAWARARDLREVKKLVWTGQAHGILVYADGEPVGWCQFGRAEELPVVRDSKIPARMFARHPSSEWRITCFTTRMDYRRQGVASTALAAAVEAIRKRGGGWIEATPKVFGLYDPKLRKLRATYGWRSREVEEYVKTRPAKVVRGIGPRVAAEVTPKTAPNVGMMSMFERLGFKPTKPEMQGGVVMRLKV